MTVQDGILKKIKYIKICGCDSSEGSLVLF